jgi:hypothetical protein
MTIKRTILLILIMAGLEVLMLARRSPQLGGTFEGEPYLVTGDAAGAWTVYLSVGTPGTSGPENWPTIVLYGEGVDLLAPIIAARDAGGWVRLETEPPDPLWWASYRIQGVVTSATLLP